MKIPENLFTELTNRGYKLTAIRKALVEILLESRNPLSITDLLSKLQQKNSKPNKTTIYRDIELLKNLKIVLEIEFGDGKKRYELSRTHHHHIICINCKKIEDIIMEHDLNILEQKIIKKMNYKAVGHNLEFFGLCQKCRK